MKRKRTKMYQNKNWLYNRYVREDKTITEMAKEAGCVPDTIQRYLEKYGLIRNGRRWVR